MTDSEKEIFHDQKMQCVSALAMGQCELLVRAFMLHKHGQLSVTIDDITIPGAGVAFQVFENLFKELTSAAKNNTDIVPGTKQQVVDYFWNGNVVRRYLNNPVKPQMIRRCDIARLDLNCLERQHLRLKICLKNETPLRSFVPKTNPMFVTVAETWTFTYKQLFEYRLTKSSSGVDKHTACNFSPEYNITLSILKCKKRLDGRSTTSLTNSMLWKAIDILGRYNIRTGVQDFLTIDLDQSYSSSQSLTRQGKIKKNDL